MIKRQMVLISIFLAVMIITVWILLKQGMRMQRSIKTYELKIPDPPLKSSLLVLFTMDITASSVAAENVFR